MSIKVKIDDLLSRDSFSIGGEFSDFLYGSNKEVVEDGGFINHYHMLFCGGTSIRNILIQSLGPDFLNISRFNGVEDILKGVSAGRLEFDFCHQHYAYPLSSVFERQFVNLIPFRDPVGYFKSSYNKPRSFPGKIVTLRRHAREGFCLEEILDYSVYTSTNNPLSRQLAVLHPDFSSEASKYLDYCGRLYRRRRGGGEASGYFYCPYEEQSFYAEVTRFMGDQELKEMAVDVVNSSNNIVFPVRDIQEGVNFMFHTLGFNRSISIPHVGKSKDNYIREDALKEYEEGIREVNSVDRDLHEIISRWSHDIYN